MADDAAATATTTTDDTSTSTDDDTTTTGTTTAADASGGDEAQLGPEGEKALTAFKNRARTAEKKAKDLEDRLAKIEQSTKSETEKALDKARQEAKAEAEQGFEKERRSDRLQVAVAKHARELADVDDVVLNLERGDLDELFDTEGKVDAKAVKAALDALLKEKPHLKATGAGRPQGSANGGEGEGGEGQSFNDQIRAQARGKR